MSGKKENKVQFNLKNVHYALLNGTADAPAWDTPKHVPGAVTLTMEPQGDVTPFYADGVTYYQSVANNGYAGDLEIARFPDQMLVDIWGFKINDGDKVITENATVEPKAFALLYQIDGDANNDFYCLYNCTGTRPAIGGTTNTDTKTPQTRSSSITAVPLENGNIMARTTADTLQSVKDVWFKKVYEENSQGTEQVSDEENP